MSIKVMIAEDHDHTRQGIVYGLEKYGDLTIVAEVTNGFDAVKYADKQRPDVILMDIMMPVMSGISATKQIKEHNKNVKIIMLTSYNEREQVLAAFSAGANAYCMKNISLDELYHVIKNVMEGSLWMDSAIAGYILEVIQSKAKQEEEQQNKKDTNLTAREKEILKLIASGMNNKDISDNLCLSLHTVKNHVRSVIHKLAVADRTQAAIAALKDNLI